MTTLKRAVAFAGPSTAPQPPRRQTVSDPYFPLTVSSQTHPYSPS
jgi:hypothetical protein